MERKFHIETPREPFTLEILPMDFLDERDQARILDFASFDPVFDASCITKASGRNVFFPQIVPLAFNNAFQVSGAGLFDMGIRDNSLPVSVLEHNEQTAITPPSIDSPVFTHITTIVKDGKIQDLTHSSPLGSYTQESADIKFHNTHKALNMVTKADYPFLVPFPVTKIRYHDIPDKQGGKQSAIVFNCPQSSLRTEDTLMVYINNAIAIPEEAAKDTYINKQFMDEIIPVMYHLGKAAHFLHNQGLCHYQMTLGNTSPVLLLKKSVPTPVICLYDWETLMPIDPINPALAKAYDISVAIGSVISVLQSFHAYHLLSTDTLVMLGYHSLLTYLQGLTNVNMATVHKKLKFNSQEYVNLASIPPQYTIDIIRNVVQPRLKDYL